MYTKIFCDIADISLIKKFNNKSIVKGFTTNPSLMRKAGAKDYKSYSKKILKVCKNKPISFEVFADDQDSMIEQGMKINSWGNNVYVKVPVVNSKNKPPKTTPKGRRVVVCPAQIKDGVTCSTCKLCSKQRSFIVAFIAHGTQKKKVDEVLL